MESVSVEPIDPIMQFFGYAHLPPAMQAISQPFCELAKSITDPSSPAFVPRNPERSAALRKLLEAKDCAVRAGIFKSVEAAFNLDVVAEQAAGKRA